MKIRNREELLSHGDVESRRIVLDITERTLEHLDARARIRSIARMEGDYFCVGERRWDLSKKRNVYLIGAGKAKEANRTFNACLTLCLIAGGAAALLLTAAPQAVSFMISKKEGAEFLPLMFRYVRGMAPGIPAMILTPLLNGIVQDLASEATELQVAEPQVRLRKVATAYR